MKNQVGLAVPLLLWATTLLCPGEADAATTPVAVLVEANPWKGRSTEPKFVLYVDGSVIWRKGPAGPNAIYLTVKLSETETKQLNQALALSTSFLELKPLYDLIPNLSDQPATEIYLSQGGRHKAVTVVGLDAQGAGSSDRPTDSAPVEFLRLRHIMATFDHGSAKPWRPEYLVVRIWPFEHAKEEGIPWPAGWPDLNSAGVERHDQGFLLRFPARLETPLKDFLIKRGSTRPAIIDGRKWSVAYQYELPAMATWEKVLVE